MITSLSLGWLYCYALKRLSNVSIHIINITNKSCVSEETFAALLRCDTTLSRRLPRVGRDWPCQPVFALGSSFWIQQLLFFLLPRKKRVPTNVCLTDSSCVSSGAAGKLMRKETLHQDSHGHLRGPIMFFFPFFFTPRPNLRSYWVTVLNARAKRSQTFE